MPLSKYEIIKQDLVKEIKGLQFLPGDKFYSESELKSRYGVSSITVVKALNELTQEGFLTRIQGKGTFVAEVKLEKELRFKDFFKDHVTEEHVDVLSIEKAAEPEILAELMLDPGESYYKFRRTFYSGETPFLYVESFVPESLIALPLKENESYVSLNTRLRKDFDIDVTQLSSKEMRQIIFPNAGSVVDELRLKNCEPVVLQQKYVYLKDHRVAEYTVVYKHWRYFKTQLEIIMK